MTDHEKHERTTPAAEAAAVSGSQSHGSRAADIQAGLIRYLAAEAYREKVEETRENEQEPRTST